MSSDSPAIKMYRDKFRLNLNAGRRADVESTVTDLATWEYVLNSWGYYDKRGKWKTFNPLSIGKLLSEYERISKQPQRSNASNGQPCERRSDAKTGVPGIPERRERDLPCMPEGTGVHLRAGSKTLEEVVTKALSEAH